jgi:hypothetical protein
MKQASETEDHPSLISSRYRVRLPGLPPKTNASRWARTGTGRCMRVASVYCGVAQIAVHVPHKGAGSGASPLATTNSSAPTSGVDLISHRNLPIGGDGWDPPPGRRPSSRWPEGLRASRYERERRRFDSYQRGQFSRPRDLRHRPSEGWQRWFESISGDHAG